MEQYLKHTPDDGELLKDPVKYRRLVGRLIYLTVIRPDIAFSVRTLSQYIQAPRKSHWDAAVQVLKYIKGSPKQGLLMPSENNLTLTAYCDLTREVVRQLGDEYVLHFFLFFYYLMKVKRKRQRYQDH